MAGTWSAHPVITAQTSSHCKANKTQRFTSALSISTGEHLQFFSVRVMEGSIYNAGNTSVVPMKQRSNDDRMLFYRHQWPLPVGYKPSCLNVKPRQFPVFTVMLLHFIYSSKTIMNQVIIQTCLLHALTEDPLQISTECCKMLKDILKRRPVNESWVGKLMRGETMLSWRLM